MAGEAPIAVEAVNHHFGSGELRKQILFDVSVELQAGEIVIVTGPSGSGKTTLLTLVGALRSAQEGSVRVLGQELRAAAPRTLQTVRRRIGYIFQSHNLIEALSALQNVELALLLDPRASRGETRSRAREMLESVGLGARLDHHPGQLSGGQRQRVAIARALAGRPRIVLADEPTASLDKKSGRDVVDLMQQLAREQGVTVLMVTHDHRVLDVADRILHLEDGRISSFTDAVASNTRQMMHLLADNQRKTDLEALVRGMPEEQFRQLLEQVTDESQRFLEATDRARSEAFESMLEQALGAFTAKLGLIMGAGRASLFLVDPERGELWLKVAQREGGRSVDVRIPIGSGIAGHVASTGRTLRVDDAYQSELFNPEVDRATGFRTRSILCVPLQDQRRQVFAVAQLLNRLDGAPFDDEDEKRFRDFCAPMGVILESWARMQRARQAD